jgi:hypothetical protein
MPAVEYARGIVATLAVEIDPAGRRIVACVSDRERGNAVLRREVRVPCVPAKRQAGKIDTAKSIGPRMRFEPGQAFRERGEVDAALDAKERGQTSASSAGG